MTKPTAVHFTEDLERFVLQRTEELKRSNDALRWELRKSRQETAAAVHQLTLAAADRLAERETRRAALNLMEDAVQAREAAHRENDERRQVEQQLWEANRRKDEFLATLAHELRNPLAPIQNSLYILRLAGAASGPMERALVILERQVGHMVRLIDDLLEVARINHGKFELHKARVELASVIQNAVEISKPLLDAAKVEFTLSLPPEPLTMDGDAVRLTQALANLLNNAAKYTEPGGRVWLDARRDGTHAVIVVGDSGAGIAPEMMPRIFELFAQVDRTLGRSQGGLGIGLSLVRNLIELHGGYVSARSEGPGHGSEFEFRLPILDDGRPEVAPAASDLAPAFAGCRILIVDDNRDGADTLALLLKQMGAEVVAVNDGPTALDAVSSFQPRLVLLDIGMPQMDGHEVARRIRARADGNDLVLVALTGWGHDEARRRSREAGFDHHFIKPVDFAALRKVLSREPNS